MTRPLCEVTEFPLCCPHRGVHEVVHRPRVPSGADASAALASEPRRAILALLSGEPALTTQELRQRLGMGWGAAVHHLRVLERAGVVEAQAWGRQRHWYPAEGVTPWTRRGVSALRRPGAARIHEAIRKAPGVAQRELARRLGLHPDTVRHHAERLEAAGLLWRDRGRDATRLYARNP